MPRNSLSTIFTCFLLASLPIYTHAHMQMSSPYPIRSPLDPNISYLVKDYDMTNPLFPDGSDFVCKNYQHDDSSYAIKATYVAGGTYQMSVTGTANHEGGSCQLSLSYDNGLTFKVIKSIIGGCPLSNTYTFTIPSTAPASSTVLFSWSWFNIVGNREMYQNCARVKIVAGPNQRLFRRDRSKRQSDPLLEYPDMFACNVGNGCRTIERREVVFPNPGSDVSYGQDSITPDPGPGFTISGVPTATSSATLSTVSSMPTAASSSTTQLFPPTSISVTSASTTGTGTATLTTTGTMLTLTGSQTTFSDSPLTSTTSLTTASAASSTLPQATSATTSSTLSGTSVTGSTLTASTSLPGTTLTATTTTVPTTLLTSTSVTISATSTPSSTALPLACTPGTFTCNSPSTFSQCVATSSTSTTFIYMGSVAAGMQCVNGQFTRQNDGPCTPSGSIFCKDLHAFYMCDQGGLVPMGAVAPGTECLNGQIVVAQPH